MRVGLSFLTWAMVASAMPAAPETGFQAEVTVKAPCRFDWSFVVEQFHPGPERDLLSYRSDRQRYQLFVPEEYRPEKKWPLVVFVSPGDDPLGWRFWSRVCTERGLLFCAAYGAGNSCLPARRTRIVLDMLDDVRRRYHIDPDRTYLAGFAGGADFACNIAFALPEYCGGVAAVSGGTPLPRLDYLRHRVVDRLSVALVVGADDFTRRAVETGLYPVFQDLSVRSKLWMVPKLGHSLPGPETLANIFTWLEEDLKRRRDEGKGNLALAATPRDVADAGQLAAGLLDASRVWMILPEHLYRAAALLEGAVARGGKSEAAREARALLRKITDDPRQQKQLEAQRAADRGRALASLARAQEQSGQRRRALETWQQLARLHPDSAAGKQAAEAATRLGRELAGAPYLGIGFEGASATVRTVVAGSPAERAGLREGDTIVKFGNAAIASLADLRAALERRRPGERVQLEVEHGRERRHVVLEIGASPGT